MIIGLTGRNASGKGEVAEFLKTQGFIFYSLSDVIRDEIRTRGEEVTRDRLIETGRQLRLTRGTGYLARMILKKLEIGQNYVVDSFRNPVEVEVFRTGINFRLLAITASPEIRFERIRSRGRESDPKTLEEFNTLEADEAENDRDEGQKLLATEALADFVIENNEGLEQMHLEVSRLVQDFSMGNARPSWDRYFMDIAKVVATRSNCSRRQVAAVIVKDKRIISTGYNGTPRGTRNCNEGGCPRCNNLVESGTRLDECLCSHAEENSITQAAYHGVSVKGGTIYSTFAPCLTCTKMIINSGISEVVYSMDYPLNEVSLNLLKEAGIISRPIKGKSGQAVS